MLYILGGQVNKLEARTQKYTCFRLPPAGYFAGLWRPRPILPACCESSRAREEDGGGGGTAAIFWYACLGHTQLWWLCVLVPKAPPSSQCLLSCLCLHIIKPWLVCLCILPADGSLYEFDIADNKWRERGRGEFKVRLVYRLCNGKRQGMLVNGSQANQSGWSWSQDMHS